MADESFETWYARLDRLVMSKLGLGVNDLADWDSRGAFDDGLEPAECLEIIAEAQDFPGQFHQLFNMPGDLVD